MQAEQETLFRRELSLSDGIRFAGAEVGSKIILHQNQKLSSISYSFGVENISENH